MNSVRAPQQSAWQEDEGKTYGTFDDQSRHPPERWGSVGWVSGGAETSGSAAQKLPAVVVASCCPRMPARPFPPSGLPPVRRRARGCRPCAWK